MSMTIQCPHCGAALEITEALLSQVRSHILSDLKKQQKEQLELERKKLEEELQKRWEEKTSLEFQDLKKQLEERDEKVAQMREEELKLREEKRKLEEREKELTLEVARRIDEERKKVEESLLKQLQEQYRLKELEKDKVIQDLRKSLEDMQRKAQQGSQQTQGEVAELDLEDSLRFAFPTDHILPVEKGVKGADIRQVVKTHIGNTCGIILWEVKRTKLWDKSWPSKLKDDLRAEKANIPIIVSSMLPEEARSGFGFVDGVYVVSFSLAIPIAHVLRQRLIDIAREKFVNQYKETSSERLYQYVTSHEFRQQIEAMIEVYQDMQQQIMKERSAFEKLWKTREEQIKKLLSSTATIVGSVRGVIGQSFSPIKGLELLESDDEEQKEAQAKLLE